MQISAAGNLFLTISRPILHITAQIKCPDPCFQGQI